MAVPTRSVLLPGDVVAGRYELGRTIGSGGMATVFAAHDQVLDRGVAVKVGMPEETVARRFEAEALLAAQIRHPATVEVYDAGEEDGLPFIVMEQLPGRTLRDVVNDDGPLDADAARRLARDLLGALAAAHAVGVLHRDLKPSNVLVARHGGWKLADFGIAKRVDHEGADLTVTGTVVGTPAFLAPERLAGADATVQSDLYGAAALLTEAMGSEPSPPGVDDATVQTGVDPDPGRAAILAALAPALAHRPSDRPASAADLLAAVDPAAAPRPVDPDPTAVLPLADAPTSAVAVGTMVADPDDDVLPSSTEPQAPRRRWLAALGIGVAALVGVGLIASAGTDGFSPVEPKGVSTTTEPRPTTTAPPTTVATTVPATQPTAVVAPPAPTPKAEKGKGKPKGKKG